jgi:hypothetical protein
MSGVSSLARWGCVALGSGALVVAGCGGSGGSGPNAGSPAGPSAPGLACTEIGCSSGLQLNLRPIAQRMPDARRVRLCLDSHCRTFSPRDPLAMLTELRIRSRANVQVTMAILGAGGKVLQRDAQGARIVRTRPNGPGCKPICFQVPLALDAKSLRLTQSLQSG